MILLNPFKVAAPGAFGSFSLLKTVTVAHANFASTLTSFPLLFSETHSYFCDGGHGGTLTNVNNIAFFTDAGLTTLADYERESHSLTSGAVIYHVRIPSASSSVDSVIYIGIDTANTTDHSNTTGVWDSNYKVVWHLGDGTTLSTADSTSNGLNGTTHAGSGSLAATTGKIGGAQVNTLDAGQYTSVTTGDPTSPAVSAATVSFWAKVGSNTGGARGFWNWSGAANSGTPFMLIQNNGGTLRYYADSNYRETSTSLTVGVWTYISMTLASATTWKFYRDGALLSTYTGGVTGRASGTNQQFLGEGFSDQVFSALDEFRLSTGIARSGDWIAAEYNNQNAPSSFYTIT